MRFDFNSLDIIETPKIAICRADLKMLGYLNPVNVVIKPTFCNLSELTFKCYEGSPHYNSIRKDNVLEIEGFGRFLIVDPGETKGVDGCYKTVTAHSWEETLNKRVITYNENTKFKLWDAVTPESGSYIQNADGSWKQYPTLLYLIQQQTGWTIKHVDASLLNEMRTIDIDGEEIYALLMNTISDAYKCFFEFDNVNKEIYCYTKDENVYQPYHTGINFSFQNLITEQTKSQSSDDIITALTVKGAEGVGISLVNPIGNDTIYDFSYYMNNEEWGMDLSLQTAIKNWQKKIEDSTVEYKLFIENIRSLNVQILETQSSLDVKKSELKALQDVQAVNIAANNSDELQKNHDDVVAKEKEIAIVTEMVNNLNDSKTSSLESLTEITTSLSFENNFTKDQLESLQYFINGSVYENDNFVFTTDMTENAKLEAEESLYNYGLQMLKKMCTPLFQYTCKIAPFMFDKNYDAFTKNLKLGGAVNLEHSPGEWVEPKIIQITLDYDNPENCTITLSDTFRIIGGVYEFSAGFNQAIKASRKTSASAPLWDEPNKNGFYNSVTKYINESLDASRQEIINAQNQEITIGSYGFRAKKWEEQLGAYNDCQVAITNNVIAFTDDNWQSCKTAIGKINVGDKEYYGLSAQAIMGELIAGSQLIVRDGNADGTNVTFRIDENGASLENATFQVYNDKSRILLNPDDGFKIQKKKNDSWEDILTEDSEGNIIANSIKVKSGELGGWTIQEDGIYSNNGDTYLKKDGTGKISLMTYGYNDGKRYARFDGDIYANNLKWTDEKPLFVEWTDPTGANPKIWAMSGSWLGYGSIDPAKRNVGMWDEIYATKAYIGTLIANYITADQITAGDAEFEGTTTKILYGNRIYVGSKNNKVELRYTWETIDSAHQNLDSLYITAAGNIHLETFNGKSYANAFKSDSVDTRSLICRGDLTVSGGLWINGGIAFDLGGTTRPTGQTVIVDLGSKILHFVSGVLVQVDTM